MEKLKLKKKMKEKKVEIFDQEPTFMNLEQPKFSGQSQLGSARNSILQDFLNTPIYEELLPIIPQELEHTNSTRPNFNIKL